MAAPGYLFSTIGILTTEYTEVLKIEPTMSALVGSVLTGVFLFSSKYAFIPLSADGFIRIYQGKS